MATPTSTLFDILDMNSRSASTADAGDVLITDSTSGALVLASGGSGITQSAFNTARGLALRANASASVTPGTPVLATYRLPIAVPELFTFEFDISLPWDMPADFSDQNKRIFVGAANRQGLSAGFLFSKKGIGLAPSPFTDASEVRTLAGSANTLLSLGEWIREDNGAAAYITVRALVDNTNGRMSLYITPTATAYKEDLEYGAHTLSYTVSASETTLNMDQVLVALRSDVDDNANFSAEVSSLRLASTLVSPPQRPTAVIPYIDAVRVGRRLQLDGRGSYDPLGSDLTYRWEIEEAPFGSKAELSGGTGALATLGTGNSEFTVTSRTDTDDYNGVVVRIENTQSTEWPLMVEYDDVYRVLTIQPETNSVGSVVSTAQDVVDAFSRKTSTDSAGYYFDAELTTTSDGTGTVTDEIVTMSGGVGSSKPVTGFLVDVPGIYRISLFVNNGTLDSLPEMVHINATREAQLLKHRPNSEYVFKSLSDFWNLVQDKAEISTAWSAFTQIISADLLKLMQNDYAKSIRDVQRRYQRRWLDYSLRIDMPESLQVAPTKPVPGDAHYFIAPTLYTDSFTLLTDTGAIVDADGNFILEEIVSAVKGKTAAFFSPAGAVKAKHALDYSTGGSGESIIRLTTQAIPSARLIASGLTGKFVEDSGGTPTNYIELSGLPKDKGLRLEYQIQFEVDGIVYTRDLNNVAVADGSGNLIPDTLEFDGTPFDVDGLPVKWQLIDPEVSVQMVMRPFFDFGANTDLTQLQMGFGSSVEITYNNPFDNSENTALVPIIHSSRSKVFVDWRHFLSDINEISQQLFDAGDPLMASQPSAPVYDDTADFFSTIRVKSFVRGDRIPTFKDTVDIPFLGETTVNPKFAINRDFIIENDTIQMLSAPGIRSISGEIKSGKIYLETPLVEEPSAIIIQDGVQVGIYPITSMDSTGKVLETSFTFEADDEITARFPRYSFNTDVPDRLWAELTYFDNWQTIENNFGLAVGLPKRLLEDNDVDLDYLTIVRALWFAFMQGPSVGNIKMATEAFLGLPYSDVAGQVTYIKNDSAQDFGRIVVKQDGVPGYRTFYFPTGYDIAINPDTGRTIQACSLKFASEYELSEEEQKAIEDFIEPLDGTETYQVQVVENGELVTKTVNVVDYNQKKLDAARKVDDSRIRAFAPLLDAVDVFDYVSQPERINDLLSGQNILTKFHKFAVELPTKSLGNLNFLPLLKDFVQEWKPAHTQVLFFGVNAVQDQIDVTVNHDFTTTMRLSDTSYSAHWVKNSSATTTAAQVPETYPSDATTDKNPDTPTWDYATDVFDKYEAGYATGVLDDYSGDGSWNDAHSEIDPVNTLDSDLDVLKCKMWLPITKDTSTADFQIGEKVYILDSGDVELSSVLWNSTHSSGGAPGVILHIGAGEHLKIPFGVYSPQNEHPETYLVIGFEALDGVGNYGTTDRLRVLQGLGAATVRKVQGVTSGAKGTILPVRGTLTDTGNVYPNLDKALDDTDPDYDIHSEYFGLEHIFYLDKIFLFGPEVRSKLQATAYIPFGGTTIDTFRGYSASFDPTTGANETLISENVQQHPYSLTEPANEQFVPALTTGIYNSWSGVVTSTFNMQWGYTEVGDLPTTPTAITAFTADSNCSDLENLHIGFVQRGWRERHFTHGYTQFRIPKPIIQRVRLIGATTVRIEGFYFVDEDTSSPIPDETAASFTGDSGSWVFFRNADTLVETAATSLNFITGFGSGSDTVLGIDDSVQTRTGHVIEVPLPSLATGTYDIILRQYRTYKETAGPTVLNHMDEEIAEDALAIAPFTGFGSIVWGPGGWGAE